MDFTEIPLLPNSLSWSEDNHILLTTRSFIWILTPTFESRNPFQKTVIDKNFPDHPISHLPPFDALKDDLVGIKLIIL